MPASPYTIRLEPKTKEEWPIFIKDMQEQFGLKNQSDVYDYILNNFKPAEKIQTPEIDGIITGIENNLLGIRNALANLRSMYLTTIQEKENEFKHDTQQINEELKRQIEFNASLRNELKEKNHEIDKLKEERDTLKIDNKHLRDNANINESVLEKLQELLTIQIGKNETNDVDKEPNEAENTTHEDN